jgi:AcrR family transcriptional regulator
MAAPRPRTAYRARRRSVDRTAQTRRKILSAVRELLAEGAFHECTVEQVADRAGVSRATLYQHFRSRLDLVDAICNTMAENPALLALRDLVELEDADAALAETVAHSMRFWASEDAVIRELYGVVAVDPAAKDFVNRQRADRQAELQRLVRNLRRSGRLRAGTSEKRALAQLLVLTSYETFRELQQTGLGEREITKLLQENARTLLLDGDA